jgi:DNA (cytosine-5)-methyltransferase 1
MLTLGSLFAGIGGFDAGFQRAGFETRWLVEWDKDCQRVLSHHYPGVPIHGDITTVDPADLAPVDVITFGFPCQDLSVAGKRAGLVGQRSGLFWEAMRVIKHLRPAVIVAENVPGLLSSHGGRDMASVLWGILDAGYSDVGWAVLDAQWWRVPQRRRRVFIVGCTGNRRASEILAFADGLSGHPAPRRTAGQGTTHDVAPSLTGSGRGVERAGESRGQDPVIAGYLTPNLGTGGPNEQGAASSHIVAIQDGSMPRAKKQNGIGIAYDAPMYTLDGHGAHAVAHTLNGQHSASGVADGIPMVAHTLSANGADASEDGTGRGTPLVAFTCKDSGSDAPRIAPTLRAMPHDKTWSNGGGQVAIAFAQNQRDEVRDLGNLAGALPAQPGMKQQNYVAATTVRRLTPTECERLQSFPDGWTAVDGMSDSARYRMLGNAVCVNVTEWLAERIVAVTQPDERNAS